jgi:cytochrome c-type biogenesis protein
MESILSNFGQIISDNIYLSLIMALVAGLISSFSPCILSSIPLVIAYVGGYAGDNKKRAFNYSLFFCMGLTITFITLGLVSAVLGKFITGSSNWWYFFLGIIMVIVGLQLLGVINILPQSVNIKSNKKGLFGALILGAIGGVLTSPCSTPVLIAILAYVAGQGSILLGIVLLALYSIGHCTLIIVAGTSVGFVQKFAASPSTARWGKIIKSIFGVFVLLLAFYLFYTSF